MMLDKSIDRFYLNKSKDEIIEFIEKLGDDGRKFLVELSLFSMYDSRIELKINMENIKDSDTVINFIHDF